ncbi:MAG: virulence RhuM family protein [Ignavibacteria bacterium]|nr:virulence RhuM family protein [Ignavibacteria bacterium]
MNKSEIIFYQTEDGTSKIDVRLQNNTVWLSLNELSELFQRDKSVISRHIKNIYEEGELKEDSTVANFATVQNEGSRSIERLISCYNLDVIISVGYRVKSLRGTQFRIWATERLREYLIKGFTMNDDLLKEKGAGGYFEELLDRIRDIRSSEKVFYRKVLEIYATSIDYNPNADSTKLFFQTIQNKLHWAAHGHTAAEVIFQRANSQLPFMGLTAFKGTKPKKNEATIAKNYLTNEELSILNRLVSAYLDIAEVNAIQRKPMFMKDWIEVLDGFMKMSRQNILYDAGRISAEIAEKKAISEYELYKNTPLDELSEVEKQFIESIETTHKLLTKKKK